MQRPQRCGARKRFMSVSSTTTVCRREETLFSSSYLTLYLAPTTSRVFKASSAFSGVEREKKKERKRVCVCVCLQQVTKMVFFCYEIVCKN